MGKPKPFEWPTAPTDKLPVRESGAWARAKLEIVGRYLAAFRKVTKRWSGTYHIEGFAGPGVNVLRDTGERLPGTPLLALETEPAFTRCGFIENDDVIRAALEQRVAKYGSRAVVRAGDCNTEIGNLLHRVVLSDGPAFCLLDPEGSELAWDTVKEVADFRPSRPIEQLILLATDMGFVRMLDKQSLPEWGETALRRIYGNNSWKPIYEARARDEITADEARSRYVVQYKMQLEGLGYRVLERQIERAGFGGGPLYFLLFATTNDTAYKVMDDIMNVVTAEPGGQLSIIGLRPERRRRT